MSVNFSLGDLIARLNFAAKGRHQFAYAPFNKMSIRVLSLLWEQGVIAGYAFRKRLIVIELIYIDNQSVFKRIDLISKPSKRIYWTRKQLHMKTSATHFVGFYVLQTPAGLMDSHTCLLSKYPSGEVILKVHL